MHFLRNTHPVGSCSCRQLRSSPAFTRAPPAARSVRKHASTALGETTGRSPVEWGHPIGSSRLWSRGLGRFGLHVHVR